MVFSILPVGTIYNSKMVTLSVKTIITRINNALISWIILDILEFIGGEVTDVRPPRTKELSV
jgi:hypothetical protein|tara:strand:- start:15651 stop:15836 length:186 start_codon:yes stop_codon:yes gene_type:complete